VTVSGANFNSNGANTVALIDSNGNTVNVSGSSSDGRTLTFIVPSGTASNSYRIQISNGVNGNASSASSFNVN